jgi:hypothetical protein
MFAAACGRASAEQGSGEPAALTRESERTGLNALVGSVGVPRWVRLTGSVRDTLGNANPRDAVLDRAILLDTAGSAPRFFDQWSVAGAVVSAAPSVSVGQPEITDAPLSATQQSVWLERAVSYPGLVKPIEVLLAQEKIRVMMIDATQIWLVDGGLASAAPALSAQARTAFDAWRRG